MKEEFADINTSHNLTSDVIADIPNEAPVDFITTGTVHQNFQPNTARTVADWTLEDHRDKKWILLHQMLL